MKKPLFILLILLCCVISASGQITKPPRPRPVSALPGLPCSPRDFIQVTSTSNDYICKSDGSDWTLIPAGGAGTGTVTASGPPSANQVSFWTSGTNATGDAGLTYNSTTNVFTLNAGQTSTGVTDFLVNPAVKASGPLFDYQINNVSAFNYTVGVGLQVGPLGIPFYFLSRGSILPSGDGVFSLRDNATTGFGRLNLGPATSAFPAWKRSGTTAAARLADDSADAPISASNVTASGNIAAVNLAPGFTTTATAAATTTLTVASNGIQAFTGSTTQTVTLPVVTTLPQVGFQFVVLNDSSGAVTINSSGANAVQVMAAGSRATFTAKLLTGTDAASWGVTYTGGGPYDIAASFDAVPAASATIRIAVPRAFNSGASWAGTICSAGTAATAQTDFLVKVNTVTKVTLRFAASGTTCSLVSATTVNFAATDVLEIIAPASADATLANIAISIKGTLP